MGGKHLAAGKDGQVTRSFGNVKKQIGGAN